MATRFGQWEVIKDLGQGGQGWVYQVRNIGSGEIGALKRLKNTARQARFGVEIKAQKRIFHENVVRILDSNSGAEKPFVVLEFVDGRSLGDVLPEELATTSIRDRLNWFFQVCRGLEAAHQEGVLHRDIKPDNILLGVDGTVKVCDFGLAFVDDEGRITETLEQVGSRFYIAPECEEGRSDKIGKATDLYSLGKVLYHLLSGGRVFPRELHRASQYDLVGLCNDAFMEGFSRVLDLMITHDPSERMEEVRAVEKKVGEALEAYEGKFPIAGVWETYTCVFCHVGSYRQVATSKPTTSLAHNLGYSDEGNIGHENFVFLECGNCGNSQRFKMKYDAAGWFEKE